jgi:transposase InsO family protein
LDTPRSAEAARGAERVELLREGVALHRGPAVGVDLEARGDTVARDGLGHWEIREAMTEADVECILLRVHEMHPDEKPRVISDNGPQFIAKDFKEFVCLTGMTHVRTSPYSTAVERQT